MNKWQPIKTAPKDGSSILITNFKHQAIACCENFSWLVFNCKSNIDTINPTHWMPLPELPSNKTYAQLKGIHKLCEIYKNYINETQGLNLSFNNAKEKLKYDIDYTRLATKDEAFAEALKYQHQQKLKGKQIDIDNAINVLQNNFYVPKSFAKATLSEMQDVIEKTEQLGRDIGCNELFLTSNEKQQMVNFYEKNR